MALSAGARLGPYEILEPLGAGGMGEVYRAHDPRLKRDVALKVLPEGLASEPERLERFEREAQALAALNHPHIVTIFSVEETEELHFLTMELVEGKTLTKVIPRGGLPLSRFFHIAIPLTEAVSAAHERGITHRDLKPGNVMVTEEDRVKVLDFGLAKLREEAGAIDDSEAPTVAATEAGRVMGTAPYMSPEQALGEGLDSRTDLFSLGVVLYEMATGKQAFTGSTSAAIVDAILHKAPTPAGRLNPEVPDELERIINRALEKDRDLRHQSALDLRADLKRLKRETDLRWAAPQRAVAGEDEPSRRCKSIVVLPFENISADPEQDYFCDGMTDEIITDLSKIGSLRVISRNSAMKLKNTDKDTRAIGRELASRYVLEGSVRKAGNSLRITAKLVDAKEDTHLWAEKYAGTLDAVFDIQEQVSRSIVRALRLTLSPEDDRKLAERPIHDVHAYECYLRARQETWRFSEEGLERALELIRDGLELAGENAALLAARGAVYWQYINIGVDPAQNDRYLGKAEESARRALELDPESCQGHFLRGLIFNKRGHMQEAVSQLKEALGIAADDPDALYWLSLFYALCGKESAARPLAARYLEVDPLTNFSFIVGWLDYVEGDLEGGLEPFRRTYAMAPNDIGARWAYALPLAGTKRLEELSSIVDSLVADAPTHVLTASVLFLMHALRGDREEALQAVTPQLQAAARWDEVLPWMLAGGHAMLDEREKAYHWLEHAISRGFINYPFLSQHDPSLEGLRGQERFKRLMERVKDEWEHFEV